MGSIADRGRDLPDAAHSGRASRYWLSVGLSYRPTDLVSVDVGYAHLFSRSAEGTSTVPIAQTGPDRRAAIVDRLDGDFSGSANIVGASATLRF